MVNRGLGPLIGAAAFFAGSHPDRYQRIMVAISRISVTIAALAVAVIYFYGNKPMAHWWTGVATYFVIGFGGIGALCALAAGAAPGNSSRHIRGGHPSATIISPLSYYPWNRSGGDFCLRSGRGNNAPSP